MWICQCNPSRNSSRNLIIVKPLIVVACLQLYVFDVLERVCFWEFPEYLFLEYTVPTYRQKNIILWTCTSVHFPEISLHVSGTWQYKNSFMTCFSNMQLFSSSELLWNEGSVSMVEDHDSVWFLKCLIQHSEPHAGEYWKCMVAKKWHQIII